MALAGTGPRSLPLAPSIPLLLVLRNESSPWNEALIDCWCPCQVLARSPSLCQEGAILSRTGGGGVSSIWQQKRRSLKGRAPSPAWPWVPWGEQKATVGFHHRRMVSSDTHLLSGPAGLRRKLRGRGVRRALWSSRGRWDRRPVELSPWFPMNAHCNPTRVRSCHTPG